MALLLRADRIVDGRTTYVRWLQTERIVVGPLVDRVPILLLVLTEIGPMTIPPGGRLEIYERGLEVTGSALRRKAAKQANADRIVRAARARHGDGQAAAAAVDPVVTAFRSRVRQIDIARLARAAGGGVERNAVRKRRIRRALRGAAAGADE